MELVKPIIYISYLFLFLCIMLFNWLYSARAIRATKNIGLYTPNYLRLLVKLSTGIAMIAVLLIVLFLTIDLF